MTDYMINESIRHFQNDCISAASFQATDGKTDLRWSPFVIYWKYSNQHDMTAQAEPYEYWKQMTQKRK